MILGVPQAVALLAWGGAMARQHDQAVAAGDSEALASALPPASPTPAGRPRPRPRFPLFQLPLVRPRQDDDDATTGSPPSAAVITSVSTTVSISVSVSVATAVSTAISTAISTTTATTTDATRVVPIFYLDERALDGQPFSLLHRICGSVIGVDGDGGATTFAITTTRMDLVTATATSSSSSSSSRSSSNDDDSSNGTATATTTTTISAADDSSDSDVTTISPTSPIASSTPPAVGLPSTITQGPTTFVFTGTRGGDPGRTIVNQCRLSGTSSARCNLTHVGPSWYASDPSWNGTYSTYNYTWTSGDRYGFAPCTVTQGASLLGPPAATAVATSTNGAARGRVHVGGSGSGRDRQRADPALSSWVPVPCERIAALGWSLILMMSLFVGVGLL